MAIRNQQKPEKKNELLSKVKKYGFYAIIVLLLIKLNKPLFFIVLFTVFAFIGKQVRSQFGLKMVVLDPLMFCALLLAQFIDIKSAIIYVAINTLIVDVLTNLVSIGSFLNFFLYTLSSVLSVMLFGSMDMLIYGCIGSLMYSVLYFFFRTTVLPDDPVAVTAKSITSFVFTFLYISFFGPIFKIIMMA
ncbi:MAG: hypothetical protein HGA85_00440 [Nanoarchaeota archaeon]|nr:hypothetical protein [Nanoarchaeota archaeon]